MNKLLLAAPLLLLSLSPAAALAQNAGAPAAVKEEAKSAPAAAPSIDAAAQKLLDEYHTALEGVKDISCTIKQEAGPEGKREKSRGTYTLTTEKSASGFPFKMFHVRVDDADGKPVSEWASDGTQMQKVDFAAKKVLTIAAGTVDLTPPMDAWSVLPQWLVEDRANANPMLKLVGAKLLPDTEVAGVKCKVLETTQEMEFPAQEEEGAAKDAKAPVRKVVVVSTKVLGAEDHMPRSFSIAYKFEGDPAMAMNNATMTGENINLKVNAGLKAADFAIKTPEGFTAEKADAKAMGLEESEQQPELKAKVGDAALDFKLKDGTGADVTLASLKGRVVLLDFWATWCGPCKAAMPSVQKLSERFKDKPVSILGVNVWERTKPESAGLDYMKKKNYTYGCLIQGDDLAKAYGISGIPTMILIDADGKVLHSVVGFDEGEEEKLAKMIDEQLAKKK